MKFKIYLCFLFYFFIPQQIQTEIFFNFVVWNVGQGSWSTFINQDQCLHFDMGGEDFPIKEIKKLCTKKSNWLFLSHEDWDHLNGIRLFQKKISKLCLYFPRTKKRQWLNQLPSCPEHPQVTTIYHGDSNSSSNGQSVVYLLGDSILLPGDSTMKQEVHWAQRLKPPIKTLILGHHGSQTSTSMRLIKRLRPQQAIASARRSKYGHPHKKVLMKLKKQRVPILRTETLGHIYLNVQFRSFESKAYIPFPNQ